MRLVFFSLFYCLVPIIAVVGQSSNASYYVAPAAGNFALLKSEIIEEYNKQHFFKNWATWEQWYHQSGEQFPDFKKARKNIWLPEVLQTPSNRAITTQKQWHTERKRLKDIFAYWVYGQMPPLPNNVSHKQIWQKPFEGGTTTRIELHFGPGKQLHLTADILTPDNVNNGLPAVMTQWNHYDWARIAVKRGFVGVVYAAADIKDDTENYQQHYPAHDFKLLARRAWGARILAHYLKNNHLINTTKLAITGHSRNAKQSLIAAAYDSVFNAVVCSNAGSGGEIPWRLSQDCFDTEPLSEIVMKYPDWFQPRLMFYAGHENYLPFDQHQLLALIAPRPLLLSITSTERQGNPWAIHQTAQHIKPVWQLLHKPHLIKVRERLGHHATQAHDIEAYLDFLNYAFEQNPNLVAPQGYKTPFLGNTTLQTLPNNNSPNNIEANKPQTWFGTPPPQPPKVLKPTAKHQKWKDDYQREFIGRPDPYTNVASMSIGPYYAMGDYLWGYLYYPTQNNFTPDTTSGPLPAVVYLHEFSFATGFTTKGAYLRKIEPLIEKLCANGIAVLCFDMLGFGSRQQEATFFYKRYPNWSLIGKMVADAQQAAETLKGFSFIDSTRIGVAGYSLGATVGLLALQQSNTFTCGAFSCPLIFETNNDSGLLPLIAQKTHIWPQLAAITKHHIQPSNLIINTKKPLLIAQPNQSGINAVYQLNHLAKQLNHKFVTLHQFDGFARFSETQQKLYISFFNKNFK